MARTIEKRSGRKDGERPALVGETIHEYFAPEKSARPVLRGEIGSLFLRFQESQRARRWYRRAWTWVKRKVRPYVDFVDFLKVLRTEEQAVDALAKDAGQKPESR